jgi:hypothetical protein
MGTYQDLSLSTQTGVTLVVVGGGKVGTVNGTRVVGSSPAVEVDGGNVVLADLDLTTDTDAPTLLVTGGNLMVRDSSVEGSTAYSDPAIAISGGSTVDLGTPDTPGGNTITVTGTAPPIQSTGTNVIQATGDTVQANGVTVSVVANVALTSSANLSLLNQPITFTATVGAPDTSSAAPTGNVTFVDQTTGNTLAVVALSAAGTASWNTSGLAVNAHIIAAVYSGDTNYITSAATLVQQVNYSFSGFAAPLNTNLAFGLNRTIPIQFQLTDYNGVSINSLSAIQSLQVLDSTGTNVLTNTGSTTLRYDSTAKQFIDNWSTKGLTAGTYTVTLTLADGMTCQKQVQLSANGKAGALMIDGSTTADAVGSLLGGDVEMYADNANGNLTTDELARIQDAVIAADAVTEPYGVKVEEVTDPTLADVTLNMDTTSAVGGFADGVLGCTTDGGQITIIAGWNFYDGSDATRIGAGQYDFETVVTHELGHALGLGHSTDNTSVMYATLNAGTINRTLTAADLNVPDSDTTGACGLHAAMIPIPSATAPAPDTSNNPVRIHDALFALLGNLPGAPAGVPAAPFANVVQDLAFANPSGDFGTMRPAAVPTAQCASSVLATGPTSADDSPFGIASIFPDSFGEGTEDQLVPMASPWVQPDVGADIIPAARTVVMESWTGTTARARR